MGLVRWLWAYRRNLVERDRLNEELEEELRGYVEMLTEEKIGRGMEAGEARRLALMEVGGIEQVKEKVREERVGAMMDTLWRDLRYGLRVLLKQKAFTLVAVLTLALGIGANTAIFSVINAVFLSPLPFPESEQLVDLYETFNPGGFGTLCVPNLHEWQQQNTVFEGIAGYMSTNFNL